MRKIVKLTVVSTILFAGMFIFSNSVTRAGNSVTSFESAMSSRTLYIQNCASCHGANGKSQTAEGRELLADDLTTPDAKGNSLSKNVRVITNGKGDMPGFKKRLSAAQITSIAKYIKLL